MSDSEEFVVMEKATVMKKAPRPKATVLGGVCGKFAKSKQRIGDTHNRRVKRARWREIKREHGRRRMVEDLIPILERGKNKGDAAAAAELEKYKAELATMPKHGKVPGDAKELSEHLQRLVRVGTCEELVHKVFEAVETIDEFITKEDRDSTHFEGIGKLLMDAHAIFAKNLVEYKL